MKNTLKFYVVLLLIIGCEKGDIIEKENSTISIKNESVLDRNSSNSTSNELIILYPNGTTDAEKEKKRAEYGVTDYKQCQCADENLELWIFNGNAGNDINIEEKKQTAKVDEELDGADLNPTIKILDNQLNFNYNSLGIPNDALTKVVDTNQHITIAVLDTGINYYYDNFSDSFLYNASDDGCADNNSEELFGWNFVDNNNNPFDDHPSMHGTVVSHMITSNLDNHNVLYQLLPVKVANENGYINYFDALCGFQYATKKQYIKIINMSFGWYNENYGLLNDFIDKVEDEILVVCSAGNDGENNDILPHYPSSFESENILSIAGFSEDLDIINSIPNTGIQSGLTYFSNYGINSVDLATVSENIPFVYNNEIFYYDGTSFSAAYASFYSAYRYQIGMSAQVLKNEVIGTSIYSTSLFQIKHSAYIYED